MLSEAKHLCAHRERPFPFAALRALADALRVTTYDRSCLLKIIIGGGRDKSGPTGIQGNCLKFIIIIRYVSGALCMSGKETIWLEGPGELIRCD